MKARAVFYILFIAFFSSAAMGQRYLDDDTDDYNYGQPPKVSEKKVFYGGSVALTFSQPVFFSVAPVVGYQVTKIYNVGIGIPYIYTNNFGQKSNLLGFRYFNQLLFFRGAMLHLEYEAMNYPRVWTDGTAGIKSRSFEHSLNVGLGYRQYLTARQSVWVDLYLLYNAKWKSGVSIYSSPFILRTMIAFK